MESSFSSRDFAAEASLMAVDKRSTSAVADLIFCPETASCSVSAAMRASDSLSLPSAASNAACFASTSVAAVEISNLRRSHLWLRSSSFVASSSISALISIRDADDDDPPRARCEVMTSPSRVTTVTCGCWARIDSAPRALSATTVVARSEARSSVICVERTWLRSEV